MAQSQLRLYARFGKAAQPNLHSITHDRQKKKS
jgi:hypothetical protein